MPSQKTPSHLLLKPCNYLKNVGEKTLERLKKCGIFTIHDLLFHLPLRYQDKTCMTPIRQLTSGDYAVIQGHIIEVKIITGRKPTLLCHVQDDTGVIALRFFHFSKTQQQQFNTGGIVRCFGTVRFWQDRAEMIHPEYRYMQDGNLTPLEETLTPVYPSTDQLHQTVLRRLIAQALALLPNSHALPEFIPSTLLKKFKLPTLIEALHYIHHPPRTVDTTQLTQTTHPAQQRLIIEELLAQHLSLQQRRNRIQQQLAPPLHHHTSLGETFVNQLPFALTTAQQRVLTQIDADIEQQKPMLRLIQGDVGSGKTVVAALAMLKAVENGFQAALMAPTELLSEQHFCQFQRWFSPLNIEVGYLASHLPTKIKETLLTNLHTGKIAILVGTHALLQKNVDFHRLGMVVIDEQHRFGVHQRLTLWQKGITQNYVPHQLILTATPIPRTLAMVFYADLDVSIIDELPPGRTKVKTVVIPNQRRDEIITRIAQACTQGKQAYWVCTLIDESEALQCQAAEVTTQQLRQLLPDLSIGLVHGRMKAQDKEITMQAFRDGAIDLLIATTVIEVGVDVPNASLMIIENAERLGLSQLHQLRGRVGRGAVVSYCVLLYQTPLSPTAQTRLATIRDNQDGFYIAKKDLELRGPGEVLGTKQTGTLKFRIADIVRDQKWLPIVQTVAETILSEHPDVVAPLIARWLGDNEKYAAV